MSKFDEKNLPKSVRLTPLRKKVLDIISQSHKALKAYDILEILRKEGFNDKPPTIYRALDFLIENAAVYKLNIINSYCASFNKKDGIFCFLICEKCFEVEQYQNPNLNEEITKIIKNKTIKNIALEITHICKNCNLDA
jgi:Fur family zinc uptake transcriptional regulator